MKNILQDQIEIATDQERRRLFLQHINRGWLIFCLLTLVTLPFFPAQRSQFLYLVAVIFPTYLIVRLLNSSGKTRAAGMVFTGTVNFVFYGLFLVLVRDLGATEAFRTQITVWLLMGLAVLFAGALVDKWAAFLVALFNSVLLIATRLTLAPESEPRPSILVFWWMTAIIIWLYEGTLQQTIVRAWNELAKRKQSEETLQKSEEHYRLIAQNAEDLIWTMNMEFQLTYVSPAVERALGFSADEILASTPEQFLTPESFVVGLKVFNEEVATAQRQPDPNYARVLELEYRRKDGSTFWVEMKFSFFRDATGQAISVLGVGRDITERKQSEEQIHRHAKRLEALRRIDMAITSGLEMNTSLRLLLDQLISILTVDAAVILLLEPHTRSLRYAAGRGFHSNAIQHTQLTIGRGHAGRAALERHTIQIHDLANNLDELSRSANLAGERFKSYFAVPLIVKGQVRGVLEIFHRSFLNPDNEWVDFMETLANQAAITIEDAQLVHELQRSNLELAMAYDATIEGWSRALDLRDKETEGHTQRVTIMTLALARTFQIDPRDTIHIRRGALLHDIGKIGVPDSILFKSGNLTEEEWEIMRRHPAHAYEMLSQINYLKPALDIPYCHHEKWDGTGYPRGLKGEEIPIAARIFAVADVWDAITSDRPYRKAWSKENALEYIKDQSGKYFDPHVVETFLKSINLESYYATS